MPELLSFISPDGTVTDLKSLPGVRALGDRGLDMPPFTMVEDSVPRQAGVRLREVNTGARDVTVLFFLEQGSEDALRTFLRGLARRFDPIRGDGRLRHVAGDGTTRDLVCRYIEGLAGSRVRGEAGPNYRRGALVFRAADPYWYDTAQQSQTYTTGTVQAFLSTTFLPLAIGSDRVFGTQTVTNDGDVEAWPVWTVHGPATSVVLHNTTTGQVIDLPVALTADQSVVIDTRPFRKTARRNDGANLYGSLTTDSSLWPLPLGGSTVTIEMPGASGDSYVTLNYSRRWFGP
jgi:hypothetical protein